MYVPLKEDIMEFQQGLGESAAEAIGKKVKVDGGINSSILDERLKNMENVLLQRIDRGHAGAIALDAPVVRRAEDFARKSTKTDHIDGPF